MDALKASYASDSDDSEDSSSPVVTTTTTTTSAPKMPEPLPHPPLHLLTPQNSIDLYAAATQGVRIRSFPHVQGNYALHVFIPIHIPSAMRKLLTSYIKRAASLVPEALHIVDADIALNELLCKENDHKIEQALLAREFHISLGRNVPIRVHQIDSIVAMLRQKLQHQRGYLIEFNKWGVFVNDDRTRTFLSLEVTSGGLSEICRQTRIVDDIYKLHGLPEFYKDPRPHISLVWALGDISSMLKQAVMMCPSAPQKNIFMCRFDGIECRIGKKLYTICRLGDQ